MSSGDGAVPDFRAINERILQYAQADRMSIVCECDRPGCFVNVSIPVREFEAIAATGGVSIVAHGHGDESRRVRRELGYDVVVLRPAASDTTPFLVLLEQLGSPHEAPLQHPLVG
jgi:hypothetical protein